MSTSPAIFRSELVDLFDLWEDAPPFVSILFSQLNGSIHPVVVIDAPDNPRLTIPIAGIPFGEA